MFYRGKDFRQDYSRLKMVCALFPSVPLLALTATANKQDRKEIREVLGLSDCVDISVSPDRKNIFYEKYFRKGSDAESIESILKPLAESLLLLRVDHPITIVYLPLKWCGSAYALFSSVLLKNQYYPENAPPEPKNRLFGQFHAPQTDQMKEEILCQLTSSNSVIRVVFATVAMGMGVDIQSIRQVIHIGPPHTIQQYYQETGRGGRDGKPCKATLYYNNRDISRNKPGMQDMVRTYCRTVKSCLRVELLKCLDASNPKSLSPLHDCCSECVLSCQCHECKQQN